MFFPVRDCEGVRERCIPSLFISLFSLFSFRGVEPATLPRYYGRPIKARPPWRLGFPRAFIIARPVTASGLRRDGNRKSRVEAEITSTGGGAEWRNKGHPPELIALRQEIVLSRETLQERAIKIRDNFLGRWLGRCNGFFIRSLYRILLRTRLSVRFKANTSIRCEHYVLTCIKLLGTN